ncbi:uncharacterized protein [Musca autumnalis]|uniref:uncharacterized protein n=1 Tax=Musca autumnalis TaxID=221902 RepID=UPI003CFB8B2A
MYFLLFLEVLLCIFWISMACIAIAEYIKRRSAKDTTKSTIAAPENVPNARMETVSTPYFPKEAGCNVANNMTTTDCSPAYKDVATQPGDLQKEKSKTGRIEAKTNGIATINIEENISGNTTMS